MTYSLKIAKSAEKAILKLKKRDRETHKEIMNKIDRILSDPYHYGHPLRSSYKWLWETHVNNNILVYVIHDDTQIVEIVQYLDHDVL